MKKLYLIFFLGIICISGQVRGQDFIYKFINPAFGGDTFNYQWLLSSADAQNEFLQKNDASKIPSYQTNPLEDFESSLNRQILSQLSRRIIEAQFGEETLNEGTYIFGNYQVEIGEQDGGLNIIILDIGNGDQSTIFIPFY